MPQEMAHTRGCSGEVYRKKTLRGAGAPNPTHTVCALPTVKKGTGESSEGNNELWARNAK